MTLTCTPRITVRQLNRRGACLDQVTRFRMRFGRAATVTSKPVLPPAMSSTSNGDR